jgi:hypothetical protein
MISNRPQNMTNQIGKTLVSRSPGRWSGVALGCAALAATLMTGSASATETYSLRYAPGIGGGDMSAPLDPGWYGQIAAYAYHAGKVKNSPQLDFKAGPVTGRYSPASPISALKKCWMPILALPRYFRW